jgi:hypothetical protein
LQGAREQEPGDDPDDDEHATDATDAERAARLRLVSVPVTTFDTHEVLFVDGAQSL